MRWILICMILVGCSPTEPNEAEMKKAIITAVIVLSSLGSAGAQTVTTQIEGTQRLYTRVRFTAKVDTVPLFTIPANCEIKVLRMVCDTAGSTGTDSLKIGIQGEDLPLYDSFRFGDLRVDSLQAGEVFELSHEIYRPQVAGMLYTYADELAIVCTDADAYYKLTGMRNFNLANLVDTSGSSSAMIIRKYCDGWYNANISMSYSGNKTAVGHWEIVRNTTGYDYIASERTMSPSAVGSASATGGIYLAASDSVGIQFASNSASTTFTISHLQFSITKFSNGYNYKTGSTAKVIQLYTPTATGTYRFYVEYTQIYP